VEFARQRYNQGMSIVEAAIEGATSRLRPILMTSLYYPQPLLSSSSAVVL